MTAFGAWRPHQCVGRWWQSRLIDEGLAMGVVVVVVVVVALRLVIVVELPRVLEGRQAQESGGRWGILPEGTWLQLCRF